MMHPAQLDIPAPLAGPAIAAICYLALTDWTHPED